MTRRYNGGMAQRTDIFSLGRLGLTLGRGTPARPARHARAVRLRRRALHRRARSSSRCGSTSRARPATATRCGCASAPRSTGPCMRCLGPAAPEFEVDAREVHQPGGGDELRSPYVDERRRPRPRARGRATRSRSPCPARSPARPTAAGLCPQCGANLNEEPEHAHEARAGPALGEAVGDPVRLDGARRRAPLPFSAAHGRPQAEAVARAHQPAPLAAQDHRAGAEQLPAVPPAAPPAPRVPATAASTAGARWSHVHDAHDHDHDH